MTLLLLACHEEVPLGPEGDADTDADTDTLPERDCSAAAALPVETDFARGFSGAEDFDFDADGWLVSVNEEGHLERRNRDGEEEILAPSVVGYAAGTRYLPSGDLVVADVLAGTLVRVTPEGGVETLVSGLEYPNGVEVDFDGRVYVAEQNARRVRRFDPATGESVFLAEGLNNPNGLSFDYDYDTLYVTSFGGGTVHGIPGAAAAQGPVEAALVGVTPGSNAPVPPCEGLAAGDACVPDFGGFGACDADLACVPLHDVDACDGLAAGDPCVNDAFGEPVGSLCTDGDDGLFCPWVASERIEACDGKPVWDTCRAGDQNGYCDTSWEDVLYCMIGADWTEIAGTCDDAAEGDPCSVDVPDGPYAGACASYYGELYCNPPWGGYSEHGGLDGINTDGCGNVYVTEFVLGEVWRIDAATGEVVEAASLGSTWIPNARWGNGLGGWERDVLYVMDRERGRVFSLALGTPGKPLAYP
ncbi:MAG: hypothetical protein ACOZNI_21315 [Myxococcota bacterium]